MDGAPDPAGLARAERTRAALWLYAAVSAGSLAGSVLRALVSLAFPGWGATLTANVLGSFAIGLFARLSASDGRLFVGSRTRHFVMTGLCGGFTTFSIFSLEALQFAFSGAWTESLAYVAGSLAFWLIAVWLGDLLGARLNRLQGGAP